jgi:fibronectin-binding autotransporter adhesin
MMAAPRVAPATVLTWDPLMTGTGSDGSGTWTDGSASGPANWSNGTADTVWTSANPDSAIFGVGGTGTATVTLGSPITVGDITFNAGPTYNISGTGSNTLTLSTNSTITTNVNAVIGATLVDGSSPSGLTKAGSGTLTLTGTNSYTGPTQVNAGTLVLANREIFDNNGNTVTESSITVAQGATVDLAYNNYADYVNPAIVINGDGTNTGHGLQLAPGVEFHTQNGLTLQTAPTVIDTDGSGPGVAYLAAYDVSYGVPFLTVAASASGSSSTANIDIDTYAYGYTLRVDAGSATATGDFTFNGQIVNNLQAYGAYGGNPTFGPLYTGFNKTGTGSLVLTGASTYPYGTGVANGTLILSGGDNRLPVTTGVQLGDGGSNSGVLQLNGVNQTITALTVSGSGTANAVVGGSTTLSTLTVDIDLTDPTSGAPSTASTAVLAPDTYAGLLGGSGQYQNNLNLVKTGPGNLILSGTSTYTGTTTVSAGTLTLASGAAAATVSPTTVMAGALLDVQASNGGGYAGSATVINGDGVGTGHGLLLGPGVYLDTQYGLTLQTAPTTIDTDGTGTGVAYLFGFDVNYKFFLDVTASASGSLSTANIDYYTYAYGYNLEVDAGSATATGDYTINGSITGGGTNATFGPLPTGFNKVGAGSLLLNGTSTFIGGTAITNGSILLGGTNVLPTTTAVQLGDYAGDSGLLVMNGFNQSITALTTSGGGAANAVVGGSATLSTLTIAATAADTYAGALGGTGANQNNMALVTTGSYALTLTGSSTYTGPTNVAAGTLVLASGAAAATVSPITVMSGATLDVQASNGGGYAGAPVVINGDATGTGHGLLLGGGVYYDNNSGLTLQTAPTTIDTDGTGSGPAYLFGFDVNNKFFLDVTASASGSTSTANIDFYTYVYGYNLEVDAGSATATGDFTINGSIVGSGTNPGFGPLATGFNKVGTGSLLLNGTSTYGGGTAIANGSIILGGTNVLPTTTAIQFGDSSGDSGVLVMKGYSQAITGLTTTGAGTASAVVGGSATLSTLTVNIASGTNTFAGTIGGSASNANNVGLTLGGPGKLVLSGSNTYTGPTAITAGTLTVLGSTAAGSAVTISSGAALAGTGTVAGTVSVSGTITGGSGATSADTVGTLTTGTQSWASGGTFAAKVSSTSGTGHDELLVTGLTAASGFTVALQATNGSSPAFTATNPTLTSTPVAGSYIVLVKDSESSATNPFVSPATLAALNLTLTNSGVATNNPTDTIELADEADGGNYDLIAEDVAATPEPTSLVLIGVAAAPLLLGRRRGRAAVA